MNRKARRAGEKAGNSSAPIARVEDWDDVLPIADLVAQASAHHQRGRPEAAQDICNKILAREPAYVPALNLLGLIFQASGRHKQAVKTLGRAIAADGVNAACHYNIASSYQALDRADEAAVHFKHAISFGRHRNNTEKLILQNSVIAACIDRIEAAWPLPVKFGALFGGSTLEALAGDVFLQCALETIPIRGIALERFLTAVRAAILEFAHANVLQATAMPCDLVPLSAALARQCFINEYIFAQMDEEARHATRLKDLLLEKLADDTAIPPLLLAVVAAYFPLHALPSSERLLHRNWPGPAAELVRQQLGEPLEEHEDQKSIPSLTGVEDGTSLDVMRQYEENPYPRWTINPLAALAAEREMGLVAAADDPSRGEAEILVAGCGSGQHAVEVAQYFPGANVLAVDISRTSLAYARRKTREAGLRNIEYAQADILKLGTAGRSFDRIEAVGVLHHLAEPELGWRILLSLLKPNGEMRIGLYSEAARRAVVGVRALIDERGYQPTADDIIKCRQEILRDFERRGWIRVIESADFYSMSGCRDLLFNVMEHRFTVPRIKAFLDEHGLAFLGFELEPSVMEKYQERFPGAAALTDLDKWHAFEADNPQTFRYMYIFTVRKD